MFGMCFNLAQADHPELLAGHEKTYFCIIYCDRPTCRIGAESQQDAQNHRPARLQRAKKRIVLELYDELL